MASEWCNQALGKALAWIDIINDNTLANSVLVVALYVSAATDNDLRDADTAAAVEALAGVAEVTDGSYARQIFDDTDIGPATVVDGTDTSTFDMADVVFTALAGGDSITKAVWYYDTDSTGGTDANLIPIAHFDAVGTSNGGDFTLQINASGLLSSTQAP